MVDIVHFTQSVVQVQQVADGCDDVRKDNVLRRKLVLPAGNCRLQIILGLRIVNDILQHRIVNQLRQLVRCQVDIHVFGRIHELVSDNLSDGIIILILAADQCAQYTGILDFICLCTGNKSILFHQDFSGVRIDDILCRIGVHQSVVNSQLLIVFISSDFRQIVASRVEEKGVQHGTRILNGWRISRS